MSEERPETCKVCGVPEVWCMCELKNERTSEMMEETKWTKEYINKAWNSAVFLGEPGDVVFRDALTEIKRLQSENARLIVEVKESNSLLRSSYQIALRDGNKTNWEAFRNQLHLALIRQHEIMYPKDENETRCKTL